MTLLFLARYLFLLALVAVVAVLLRSGLREHKR